MKLCIDRNCCDYLTEVEQVLVSHSRQKVFDACLICVSSSTLYCTTMASSGPGHRRHRHYSAGEDSPDCEEMDKAPLPITVPIRTSRDRSFSLPNIQVLNRLREIETGRELRRMSDEFNRTYVPRRKSLITMVIVQPLRSVSQLKSWIEERT